MCSTRDGSWVGDCELARFVKQSHITTLPRLIHSLSWVTPFLLQGTAPRQALRGGRKSTAFAIPQVYRKRRNPALTCGDARLSFLA